jgi:hypothetical protein
MSRIGLVEFLRMDSAGLWKSGVPQESIVDLVFGRVETFRNISDKGKSRSRVCEAHSLRYGV